MPGDKNAISKRGLPDTGEQQEQEVTADDSILPWQTWCQVNVCPTHAAQALLLDGAPVAEVRAVNSLSGAVWRTSQDGLQFQVCYLTTANQHTTVKKSGIIKSDTGTFSPMKYKTKHELKQTTLMLIINTSVHEMR